MKDQQGAPEWCPECNTRVVTTWVKIAALPPAFIRVAVCPQCHGCHTKEYR